MLNPIICVSLQMYPLHNIILAPFVDQDEMKVILSLASRVWSQLKNSRSNCEVMLLDIY